MQTETLSAALMAALMRIRPRTREKLQRWIEDRSTATGTRSQSEPIQQEFEDTAWSVWMKPGGDLQTGRRG
jgi:hypothetical protein